MRTVHRRASGLGPMLDLIALVEIRRKHACTTNEERQILVLISRTDVSSDERRTQS